MLLITGVSRLAEIRPARASLRRSYVDLVFATQEALRILTLLSTTAELKLHRLTSSDRPTTSPLFSPSGLGCCLPSSPTVRPPIRSSALLLPTFPLQFPLPRQRTGESLYSDNKQKCNRTKNKASQGIEGKITRGGAGVTRLMAGWQVGLRGTERWVRDGGRQAESGIARGADGGWKVTCLTARCAVRVEGGERELCEYALGEGTELWFGRPRAGCASSSARGERCRLSPRSDHTPFSQLVSVVVQHSRLIRLSTTRQFPQTIIRSRPARRLAADLTPVAVESSAPNPPFAQSWESHTSNNSQHLQPTGSAPQTAAPRAGYLLCRVY